MSTKFCAVCSSFSSTPGRGPCKRDFGQCPSTLGRSHREGVEGFVYEGKTPCLAAIRAKKKECNWSFFSTFQEAVEKIFVFFLKCNF
jgi:hypothetical protein